MKKYVLKKKKKTAREIYMGYDNVYRFAQSVKKIYQLGEKLKLVKK